MVGDTAASTNLVFESARIVEKYFRCGWWAPRDRLAPVQPSKLIREASHSPLMADDHIIVFEPRACSLQRIYAKLT